MKTKKLSKTERFLRWLDRHIVKLVMGIAITFLFHKVIQLGEQRHEFEMKMLEATAKYNEQQKEWSRCYVQQANQVQMRTRCESRMYNLSDGIRECRKQIVECKKKQKELYRNRCK